MKTGIITLSFFAITSIAIGQEVVDTIAVVASDSIIMNETMKRKVEANEVQIEIQKDKNQSTITVTKEDGSDTTRFRLGKTEIIVLEDRSKNKKWDDEDADDDSDEQFLGKPDGKKHRKSHGFDGHFASFNLGVNLLATKDQSLTLPDTSKYLELDEGKSFEFAFNPLQFNIPIVRRHLGIVSGIGIIWNNYRFDNPYTVLDNSQSSITYAYDSTRNWSKSTLNTFSVTVPLLLETQVRLGDDALWFAFGGYGTLKMGSKTKMKDSDKHKVKDRKDFHLNPLQYGITARIGYENLGIYANYSLATLFKKDEGPELYPISVGLTLTFNE